MRKVLKYTLFDLLRSKWALAYGVFYLMVSLGLLILTRDHTQALTSLLNILMVITPLLALMFSIIYFYSSREFTHLLLAQPITRKSIFLGLFLGVVSIQMAAVLLGVGVPFILFGVLTSPVTISFVSLLVTGILLTIIFTAAAFIIGLKYENRVRGFGLAVFIWLFLAVIYDGIFLILLSYFREYPLDYLAMSGILLNPIDLSRVLVMINLDIAALMGFTGAIFKNLLGDFSGLVVGAGILLIWALLPTYFVVRIAQQKDF